MSGALTLLAAFLLAGGDLPRQRDIEAKIVYVDAKNGFIVINRGKNSGLGPDFTYEVEHRSEGVRVLIGTARFEKFIGQELMTKLTVDGKAVAEMKADDTVVCRPKE